MQLSGSHFIFLVGGLFTGGLVVWLFLMSKISLANANGNAEGEIERTSLAEQLKAASREIAGLTTRLKDAEESADTLQTNLNTASRECAVSLERAERLAVVENAHRALSTSRDNLLKDQARFQATIAELNATIGNERNQTQEKLTLLTEAREQLGNQFKALANEILDDKSKKFTDQNQTNLDQLLAPLKLQLTDFKAKVEEVYINEGKDRSAMSEQVKQLVQLNSSLSQDAKNLTLALKGDRKAQGNWGEIILDDVLEKAGLHAGQHYDRQGGVKSEDGQSHVIPDVVLRLPGDRHLVVDSKMTLPDYRAFAAAEIDEERTAAQKRHLISIRAHIKELSEKNYQSLYGLKSLDFVVMFVPLEPAFMLAVTNDPELFQQAWDKNVLLVSPSTLLFVVRTVAYLWRQEGLSRNAKAISNRGAELYDKLVGFIADLHKVGERIQQAQESYNEARKKLSEGGGNVIRQAEMLKELGVKPRKTLPAQWVEHAMEEPVAGLTNESAHSELL
ncbi:MAG: DNA recombination protein RmuC [Planctomycetota bacterium]|nr:MAG: DNA recombination protein RmuC [Planctomycetota bacterium]